MHIGLVERDQLLIGQKHDAIFDMRALRTEQAFSGAQDLRVLAAIQRVAQDQLHKLRQKHDRQAQPFVHDGGIAILDGSGAVQAVAQGEEKLPILPRIGIGDRGQFQRRHRAARFGHKARMHRAFGGASLGRGNNLGAGQPCQQQFIRHQHAPSAIQPCKVMARGNPKFRHQS